MANLSWVGGVDPDDSNPILTAIRSAIRQLTAALSRADRPKSRPQLEAMESRLLLSQSVALGEPITTGLMPFGLSMAAIAGVQMTPDASFPTLNASVSEQDSRTKTQEFTDGSYQQIHYVISESFTFVCEPYSKAGDQFTYLITQIQGTLKFSGTAVDSETGDSLQLNDTFNYDPQSPVGNATLVYSTSLHQVIAFDFDLPSQPGTAQPTELSYGDSSNGFETTATILLPSEWQFDNFYYATQGSVTLPVPSVSGTVFLDANGNGVRDPGETGLSGISVYADFENSGSLTSIDPQATTAQDGTYQLDLPWPASWPIRIVTPASGTITSPPNGFYDLTIGAGADDPGQNFGVMVRTLAFAKQPTDTPAGVPIDPHSGVQVTIQNADGTPDTSDSSEVTLSIASGPTGATLGGTTSVAAVNGLATFSNLTLDIAGSYTLQASDASDADGTSHTFKVGPLELQGTFSNGVSSGTIDFGLAPTAGGQAFVPLLQTDGPVTYDNGAIGASGTFTSLVGNPAAPAAPYAFTGSFSIPDGSASTSSLSASNSTIQIAGLATSLSSLTFANIGGDNQMDFTGGINLPDSLGGFSIPLPDADPIVIDGNGIGLTATFTPDDISFMLGGALNVSATQMVLSYTTNNAYLKVQGDFKAKVNAEPQSYTLDLNLTGSNYLSYSPTQGLTLIGSLSYSGPPVPLFTTWVELDSASITINTVTSSGSGDLSLTVGGKTVEASLSILNGYFDSVSLSISKINYPLGTTGIFWQSVSGSIQNLSPTAQNDVNISGSLGFSYGPDTPDVVLPAVLGGGTFSGALIEADFSGSVTLDAEGNVDDISAKANVSVIGGLASGSAEFDCDFEDNTFHLAEISVTAFNGTLTFQGSATVTIGGPIIAYGTSSLSIPTNIPGIGGVRLASESALLDLPSSTNLSQDYFAVWGTIDVPAFGPQAIGVKIDCAGDLPTLLNGSNLPTVPLPPSEEVSSAITSRPNAVAAIINPASSTTSSQAFTVLVGTPYILLSASWAEPSGNVPFEIIAPDGTQYTNADSGGAKIAIVPSLSDTTHLSIAIDAPAAGTWQIVLPDVSAMGPVGFGGFAPVSTATVEVQAESAGGTTIPIDYQSADANPGASVALFYGTSDSGFTGTLIASELPVGTGKFQWNDSGLSVAGDYVYALVTDDENVPVLEYATEPLLPSYITASAGAAFSYNSVTGALNLTSGTLTFTADNTTGALINLTASGPASGLFFDTSEHLAGLTLSLGAQATVLSLGLARTHSNHNVLVIGTPGSANDPTFSIDSQSKLDLGDNDLILHTGSSDPTGASLYAEVEAMAALGRNPAGGVAGQPDGQWNGNGLSSSSAASADALAGYEKIGLAVVVNSTLLTGTLSSWQVGSFNESLGANDIIVKYDYLGDYALEGMVYQDDAGILQLEYDAGTNSDHTWATGSSLFDGLSDETEAGLMQLQYGLGTGGNNGQQL